MRRHIDLLLPLKLHRLYVIMGLKQGRLVGLLLWHSGETSVTKRVLSAVEKKSQLAGNRGGVEDWLPGKDLRMTGSIRCDYNRFSLVCPTARRRTQTRWDSWSL